MTEPTIWHNPRCSKSRQTLALLHDRGMTPAIRLYLEDVPTVEELRRALAMLRLPAAKLIRKGEAQFKELGLSLSDTEDALLSAMAAHPKLIERPVVFAGDSARLGRPPEAVLEIL